MLGLRDICDHGSTWYKQYLLQFSQISAVRTSMIQIELDSVYQLSIITNWSDGVVLLFSMISGTLLGFKCEADAQCAVKVPSSGCVNGVCACGSGFVPYRRHTCLSRKKNLLLSSYNELGSKSIYHSLYTFLCAKKIVFEDSPSLV